MTARLFHAVTCTPETCDPPRAVAYVAARYLRGEHAGDPRRVEVVRLPGCAIGNARIPGGLTAWDEDIAIAEVADEIVDRLHDLLLEVLTDDRDLCAARNDAAEACVRILVNRGRMPHPAAVAGG